MNFKCDVVLSSTMENVSEFVFVWIYSSIKEYFEQDYDDANLEDVTCYKHRVSKALSLETGLRVGTYRLEIKKGNNIYGDEIYVTWFLDTNLKYKLNGNAN